MRRFRLLFWLLAIALAVVGLTVVGQQVEYRSHSQGIQDLLSQYAGSEPPDDLLDAFRNDATAQDAISQVLTQSRYQESWPGSVMALGKISSLDTRRGVEAKVDLIQFMESRSAFASRDSPLDCKPVATDVNSKLYHWDRKARLSVPISLGFIVRNSQQVSENTHEQVWVSEVMSILALVGRGAFINGALCMSKDGKIDDSCNQELQMNAVRGLEATKHRGAKYFLEQIAKCNSDPLVARQAELAVESFKEKQ